MTFGHEFRTSTPLSKSTVKIRDRNSSSRFTLGARLITTKCQTLVPFQFKRSMRRGWRLVLLSPCGLLGRNPQHWGFSPQLRGKHLNQAPFKPKNPKTNGCPHFRPVSILEHPFCNRGLGQVHFIKRKQNKRLERSSTRRDRFCIPKLFSDLSEFLDTPTSTVNTLERL